MTAGFSAHSQVWPFGPLLPLEVFQQEFSNESPRTSLLYSVVALGSIGSQPAWRRSLTAVTNNSCDVHVECMHGIKTALKYLEQPKIRFMCVWKHRLAHVVQYIDGIFGSF